MTVREAAQRIGDDVAGTWRTFRLLERDGVQKCVKRGDRYSATRYQWTGGAYSADEEE